MTDMPHQGRRLSIFVSSPGDVGPERARAKEVFEELHNKYKNSLQLAPFLWEEEPVQATKGYQDQIPDCSESDIVVCIFWSRLGTPLDVTRFKRSNGTGYDSGTQFEFEQALEANRLRGKPALYVYRKVQDPPFPLSDRAKRRKMQDQIDKLEAFYKQWFEPGDDQTRFALKTFTTTQNFRDTLRQDFERIIRDHLGGIAETAAITWHDNPYRGLESFNPEHAPIFRGRNRAIEEVMDRLTSCAARGFSFLLVLGMSGCGKSSLVKAGVLPFVTKPGVVEGIGLWRWCLFRPSDSPRDLCRGLAAALFDENVLPELARKPGMNLDRLAEYFRDPSFAPDPLRDALTIAANNLKAQKNLERPPQFRLAIGVDQLEELFTQDSVDEAQRRQFAELLSALAASGFVWVLATMRSDFYGRFAEVPQLLDLKRVGGQYDLQLPTPDEIGQMIREPAQASGLEFEKDPESKCTLDAILAEAAGRDPRLLPLLEFTLEQLYEKRTRTNVLPIGAYNALGGLEGSLARKANELYARLSPDDQVVLPSLFLDLVTFDSDTIHRPIGRRVLKSALATTPARARLLEQVIQARLLVSETGSDGQAVVGIVHEALLVHWPQLQKWISDDQEFLRVRERATHAYRRWCEENRAADLLLPAGKPLAEAQEILLKRLTDRDRDLIDYINLSLRRHRLRRRFLNVIGVTAALLGVGLVVALLYQSRLQEALGQAKQNADTAQTEKNEADRQRGIAQANEAEANRQRGIADTQKELVRGFLYGAQINLADRACRDNRMADLHRLLEPYKPIPGNDPNAALRNFEWDSLWRLADQELFTLRGHQDSVRSVSFSPDGKLLASASFDKTVKLWDASTGKELATIIGHTNNISAVCFSPDGKHLATGSYDKTVKIWDAETRREIRTLTAESL